MPSYLNTENSLSYRDSVKRDNDYGKESIEITKNGIEELMSNCEAGMLEYELESYFDFYIKSNGNRQLSLKL